MDLASSFPFRSFFFLAITLLFFSKIVKSLRSSISGRKLSKLPPGPWSLPLIGSIHHLVGSLPHHRFRELSQKYGPLMHLQLGETSTFVVSSAEIAKEVLKTHDMIFAQRPHLPAADVVLYGSSNITFSPVGDYWKLLRKICSLEMVNAKRVRSFQSLREKEVSSLITYLSEKARSSSSVNLSEKIFTTIFAITSKAAFGENYKAREELLSVAEILLKSAEDRNISDMFPSRKWLTVITGMKSKLEKMHRMADKVLEKIISGFEGVTKVAEGEAECLLSALLNLKEDGGLTSANVKAVMLDMILGGTETSSTVVEWAITEMLKNPRLVKRTQAEVRQVVFGNKGCINEAALQELKYLKAVIKETLRLHPPAPFLIPRQCTQTCEINGYTVPIGTQVLVNAWAIGRDPNYWSLAEEFYPDRFLNIAIDYKGFNFEYIPFGSGKRICPGMLFGVASVELLLAQLLCHFDWELPPGTTPETLDMTETLGTTMRRKSHLILIPSSYKSCTF